MLWELIEVPGEALLMSTHNTFFCGEIRKHIHITPLIWSYIEYQEKKHFGLAKAGLNSEVVLFTSVAKFYCIFLLFIEKYYLTFHANSLIRRLFA